MRKDDQDFVETNEGEKALHKYDNLRWKRCSLWIPSELSAQLAVRSHSTGRKVGVIHELAAVGSYGTQELTAGSAIGNRSSAVWSFNGTDNMRHRRLG